MLQENLLDRELAVLGAVGRPREAPFFGGFLLDVQKDLSPNRMMGRRTGDLQR